MSWPLTISLTIATILVHILILVLNYVVELPVAAFINFSYVPLPIPMITTAVIYCGTILSVFLNQGILAYFYRPTFKLVASQTQKTFVVISAIYALAAVLNLSIAFPSNYYMYDCLPLINNKVFLQCLKQPSKDSYHALFNIPIIITTTLFLIDGMVLISLYARTLPMLMSILWKLPWLTCVIYAQVAKGSDYIIVLVSLLISCLCLASLKTF